MKGRGPGVDADELVALDMACFPASEQWSRASWAGELDATDRVVLARRDAEGFLVGAASFQVVVDTCDLLRVMVRPDQRGRRLGEQMLREGMDACAARGAGQMLLEVRTDNEAALALYRRLGFELVAGRDNYYGPGRDAWVMRVALPAASDARLR